MNYFLPLFIGFTSATLGITPPGLINMTAAKVALKEGRTRALVFAAGASIVVLLQSLIALLFARYIDAHPDVIIMLREAGLAVFLVLTAYFFFFAQKPKQVREVTKLRSKRSRFFLGMLLSALNFFPIPFYVFLSVTLSTYRYFSFEQPFVCAFSLGTATGSFFGFYCYIAFFQKLENRTAGLIRNINNVIGSITLLMSIITIVNIIRYYY